MKILLISDLHTQKKALHVLEFFLEKYKVDLVLSAGDIVERTEPTTKYLDQIFNLISKFNLKFIAVPGNNESQESFKKLVKTHSSIHLYPQKFEGYTFYGVGGLGYDGEFPVKNPQNYRCDHKTIFVSHIPPIIEIIKKMPQKPSVHICGHLHNLSKSRWIGNMLLINLPSLMLGKAAILELPTRKVKFITSF